MPVTDSMSGAVVGWKKARTVTTDDSALNLASPPGNKITVMDFPWVGLRVFTDTADGAATVSVIGFSQSLQRGLLLAQFVATAGTGTLSGAPGAAGIAGTWYECDSLVQAAGAARCEARTVPGSGGIIAVPMLDCQHVYIHVASIGGTGDPVFQVWSQPLASVPDAYLPEFTADAADAGSGLTAEIFELVNTSTDLVAPGAGQEYAITTLQVDSTAGVTPTLIGGSTTLWGPHALPAGYGEHVFDPPLGCGANAQVKVTAAAFTGRITVRGFRRPVE